MDHDAGLARPFKAIADPPSDFGSDPVRQPNLFGTFGSPSPAVESREQGIGVDRSGSTGGTKNKKTG